MWRSLTLSMFGMVLPHRGIAYANPGFLLDYQGLILALILIFGYMVTDKCRYGLFNLPKYADASERSCAPRLW